MIKILHVEIFILFIYRVRILYTKTFPRIFLSTLSAIITFYKSQILIEKYLINIIFLIKICQQNTLTTKYAEIILSF